MALSGRCAIGVSHRIGLSTRVVQASELVVEWLCEVVLDWLWVVL